MSRKLLGGIVVLSAAILAAVFRLNAPQPVYAQSVSKFLAHPLYDRPVRVQGALVPGSLCWRAEPCEYRFRLEDRYASRDAEANPKRRELSVRYASCVVPDTFRPSPGVELPITVEGEQCVTCHHFQASMLYAKWPFKYEMKSRDPAVAQPSEPFVPTPRCAEL